MLLSLKSGLYSTSFDVGACSLSIVPAVQKFAAISPSSHDLAVVPSCPLKTVQISPDLDVQYVISLTDLVVASVMLSTNCSPAEGDGNRLPVPVASVMVVVELFIGASSTVPALFTYRNELV